MIPCELRSPDGTILGYRFCAYPPRFGEQILINDPDGVDHAGVVMSVIHVDYGLLIVICLAEILGFQVSHPTDWPTPEPEKACSV